MEEADRALPGDLHRDHREDDGAGKRREIAELAGAEREAGIMRMPPGEQIGDGRDAQRRGMGCHMPAIGKQRHRSEQRSRRDLADHHDGGQGDDEPCPALVAGMLMTEEHVIVRPWLDRVRMHLVALLIPRVSEKYRPVRRNSMEMCYSPWKIGCGSGCFL